MKRKTGKKQKRQAHRIIRLGLTLLGGLLFFSPITALYAQEQTPEAQPAKDMIAGVPSSETQPAEEPSADALPAEKKTLWIVLRPEKEEGEPDPDLQEMIRTQIREQLQHFSKAGSGSDSEKENAVGPEEEKVAEPEEEQLIDRLCVCVSAQYSYTAEIPAPGNSRPPGESAIYLQFKEDPEYTLRGWPLLEEMPKAPDASETGAEDAAETPAGTETGEAKENSEGKEETVEPKEGEEQEKDGKQENKEEKEEHDEEQEHRSFLLTKEKKIEEKEPEEEKEPAEPAGESPGSGQEPAEAGGKSSKDETEPAKDETGPAEEEKEPAREETEPAETKRDVAGNKTEPTESEEIPTGGGESANTGTETPTNGKNQTDNTGNPPHSIDVVQASDPSTGLQAQFRSAPVHGPVEIHQPLTTLVKSAAGMSSAQKRSLMREKESAEQDTPKRTVSVSRESAGAPAGGASLVHLVRVGPEGSTDLSETVRPLLTNRQDPASLDWNTVLSPVPENDGVYRLRTRDKEITFSINRFGSVYTYNAAVERIRGRTVSKITEDLVILEYSPESLREGKWKVEVMRDGKVLPDAAYQVVRRTDTEAEDRHREWFCYEYRIAPENFAEEGTYRIILSSISEGGAYSELNRFNGGEISFTVKAEPNAGIPAEKKNKLQTSPVATPGTVSRTGGKQTVLLLGAVGAAGVLTFIALRSFGKKKKQRGVL